MEAPLICDLGRRYFMVRDLAGIWVITNSVDLGQQLGLVGPFRIAFFFPRLQVPISWQALLDFFVTYPAARAAALATAATSDSSSNSSSPVLPDLPPYAICIPQDFCECAGA